MPFEFESGDAWIAYIDIYGFSALVRDQTSEGVYLNLADSLKEIADAVARHKFSLQALSDSIFIISFRNQQSVQTLPPFIACVREVQDCLVAAGFLPRGAITKGKVHLSGAVIVGEAVIRSVRCEQALDIPCVVVPARELEGSRTWLRHKADLPIKGGGIMLGVPIFPDNIETYCNVIDFKLDEARLKGPPAVASSLLRLQTHLNEWKRNERNRTPKAPRRPHQQARPRSAKRRQA
jgi:hypothetical protein